MNHLCYALLALTLFACTPGATSSDEPTGTTNPNPTPEPEPAPSEPRSFPFGESLNNFQRVARTEHGGGDCEGATTRYQRDNKLLVVDSTDCYEYGKSVTTALFVDRELMEYQEVRYSGTSQGYEGELRREEQRYDFRPATPVRVYRNEPANRDYAPSGNAAFERLPFDMDAQEQRTNLSYLQGDPEENIDYGDGGDDRVVVDHYICYDQDDGNLKISVAYNDLEDAVSVQYRGQAEALPLRKTDTTLNTEAAAPTRTTTYDELLDGRKNGTYTLTKSGNNYYVVYTRGRDGKTFRFTSDAERSFGSGAFRRTPCY